MVRSFRGIHSSKKSLKLGKRDGPDSIPPEVFKCCELDDIIISFCDRALSGEGKPEQRSLDKIIPLPESGNLSCTDNYRGIPSDLHNREDIQPDGP